jgi:hypothetical protein
MNTVAWLIVGYIALDRLLTVAYIGKTWRISHSATVLSLITGGLLIWGVVWLAGGCS